MRVLAHLAGLAGLALAAALVAPSVASAADPVDVQAWAVNQNAKLPVTVSADAGDHGSISIGAFTTNTSSGPVSVMLTLDLNHLESSVTVLPGSCGSGTTRTCTLSLAAPGSVHTTVEYSVASNAHSGSQGYIAFSVAAAGDTNTSNDSGRVNLSVKPTQSVLRSAITTAPVGGTTSASATVTEGSVGGGFVITMAESDPSHALQPKSSSDCQVSGTAFTCRVHPMPPGQSDTVHATFKVVGCGPRSGIAVTSTLRNSFGSAVIATWIVHMRPTGCTTPTATKSPTPSPTPSAVPTPTLSVAPAPAIAPSEAPSSADPVAASLDSPSGANPVLVAIASVFVLAGIVAVGLVGLRRRARSVGRGM